MTSIRMATLILAFTTMAWASAKAATLVATETVTVPATTAAPADTTAASDEKLPTVPVPQFPRAQSGLDKWKQSLDQVEGTLRIRTLADSVLTDLRNQVVAAQAGARKLTGILVPPLEAAIARGAQLAPAPQTAEQLFRRRPSERSTYCQNGSTC